jgi:hypothetical protein
VISENSIGEFQNEYFSLKFHKYECWSNQKSRQLIRVPILLIMPWHNKSKCLVFWLSNPSSETVINPVTVHAHIYFWISFSQTNGSHFIITLVNWDIKKQFLFISFSLIIDALITKPSRTISTQCEVGMRRGVAKIIIIRNH